jgi:hypothetical protein
MIDMPDKICIYYTGNKNSCNLNVRKIAGISE